MPGASENTRRVTIMNANWNAGQARDDGRFELLLITSDDERHILEPSPSAMTALVALAQSDTVLVWDPDNRTLVAANLRGTMPWTERLDELEPQRTDTNSARERGDERRPTSDAKPYRSTEPASD
jgi:hypothetical protein